ncbi:hypothetical protein [Azospirillum canadense]|uniref:hypothetical protein n=1 Tax=Azospirillum canadense TaxID=403962 RepID=UPI0022260269|nr:hypothetical protein [Azospirillum canadense]MCW2240358.1 type II secretory pathway component PulF [Azospirillum canadense]
MIAATLATADVLAAGLRRHLPSPLDDAQAWLHHWRHRHDVHRFQAVRADVYRDLREDLLDGSSVQDALRRLIHIYSKKGRDPHHPALPALRSWTDKRNTSKALSDLLRPWAPSYDVTMIIAGEKGAPVTRADGIQEAALPRMLGKLIEQIDIQARLASLFLKPVRDMAENMAMAFLVIGVDAYYTIPSLRAMIDPARHLPFPANVWVALSAFLNTPASALVLVPLLALAAWIVWSFQNWTHPARLWAERHIVFYRLYRDIAGARFLKSLAPFKAAGKSDPEALALLAHEGSPYERNRVGTAAHYCVLQNYSIGESFDHAGHEFPDPALIMRLIATQGRATQAHMIEDMVDRHVAVVERRVDKVGRLAAALGWAFVGVVLAIQLIAQYQIIKAAQASIH